MEMYDEPITRMILVSYLAKGRRSKGEFLEEALDALMEATGVLGWTVCDRGMDSTGHIRGIKAKDRKGVVRVNDMKLDVFGDGLGIEASLAPVPFRTAHPRTHRGRQARRDTVEARLSAVLREAGEEGRAGRECGRVRGLEPLRW